MYEATYLLSIRDFKKAAGLLLDSISTFTATEIYSYSQVWSAASCPWRPCSRALLLFRQRLCCDSTLAPPHRFHWPSRVLTHDGQLSAHTHEHAQTFHSVCVHCVPLLTF